MTGNLDVNNIKIYNLAQPNGNNQPATNIYSDNKFLAKTGDVMGGPLNMSNNKIIYLANPTNNKDFILFYFFYFISISINTYTNKTKKKN